MNYPLKVHGVQMRINEDLNVTKSNYVESYCYQVVRVINNNFKDNFS